MARPVSPSGGVATGVFAGTGATGGGGPGMVQVTGDGSRALNSPDSHCIRGWGHPVAHVLNIGDIGAGQAVTSLISAGIFINPYPYAYLYDIVVSVTGHEATPATATVDVFDTAAAGSAAADSYLSAPFTFSGASAPKGASARFTASSPNFWKPFDPTLYVGGGEGRSLQIWAGDAYQAGTRNIAYLLQQGQIFSVRSATTAATGSITGLTVSVVLVPSDIPLIINK